MRMRGPICKIEHDEGSLNGPDYVRVTLKLFRNGEVAFRVPQHQAAGYKLNRYVTVTTELDPLPKKKKKRASAPSSPAKEGA